MAPVARAAASRPKERKAAPPKAREAARQETGGGWVMPLFIGLAALVPVVVGVSLFVFR